MIGSGLRIFNAYPAFARKGETFCCYPFEGTHDPRVAHVRRLAGGRAQLALRDDVGAGRERAACTSGFIYLHGEWRDLVPRRGIVRGAWQMVKFYLALRRDHPAPGQTQRAAAAGVFFACRSWRVVSVLSGLAIWKPVQLAPLTALLGGFVWARYWHFLAMMALVVVTARPRVHGVRGRSVFAARDDHGPLRRGEVAASARNARPFVNLLAAPPRAEPPPRKRSRASEPRSGCRRRHLAEGIGIDRRAFLAAGLRAGGAVAALALAGCDSKGPRGAQASCAPPNDGTNASSAALFRPHARCNVPSPAPRAAGLQLSGVFHLAARCRSGTKRSAASGGSRSAAWSTRPLRLTLDELKALPRTEAAAGTLLRRRLDGRRGAHRRALSRARAPRRRRRPTRATSTSSRSTTTTTRAGTSRARCTRRRWSSTARTARCWAPNTARRRASIRR